MDLHEEAEVGDRGQSRRAARADGRGTEAASATPAGEPTALSTLERYCDAVPRTSSHVESIGPMTLFVSESASWPFYARPSLGASSFSAAEVKRVRERQRLRSGRICMAVALVDGQPVAVGSHQPIEDVSEIVGVGTLPSHRRRGIGAAVTDFLLEDALKRGVRTVFLSAGSADVARIYGSVGFRPVATACVAEP